MAVDHGQTLDIKNLISFRKNVPPAELQGHIERMIHYVESQGAKKINPGISATYAASDTIIDVAVYLPIDKEIPSSEEFVFKPRLYLENCLKINYKGHPVKLEETMNKLNEYVASNELMPVSVAFVKTIHEVINPDEIELFEVDIYISICLNEI